MMAMLFCSFRDVARAQQAKFRQLAFNIIPSVKYALGCDIFTKQSHAVSVRRFTEFKGELAEHPLVMFFSSEQTKSLSFKNGHFRGC